MSQSPEAARFNTRSFTAAMAVFTGISLPFTGLANHIFQFAPFTTGRHAWMAAHNTMGILFAVFVTWHVVLNRRMLLNHLRNARALRVSREARLAGIIAGTLLFLAVGHAFAAGGAR